MAGHAGRNSVVRRFLHGWFSRAGSGVARLRRSLLAQAARVQMACEVALGSLAAFLSLGTQKVQPSAVVTAIGESAVAAHRRRRA